MAPEIECAHVRFRPLVDIGRRSGEAEARLLLPSNAGA
jgi:hypothetical protein